MRYHFSHTVADVGPPHQLGRSPICNTALLPSGSCPLLRKAWRIRRNSIGDWKLPTARRRRGRGYLRTVRYSDVWGSAVAIGRPSGIPMSGGVHRPTADAALAHQTWADVSNPQYLSAISSAFNASRAEATRAPRLLARTWRRGVALRGEAATARGKGSRRHLPLISSSGEGSRQGSEETVHTRTDMGG